MRPLAYSFFLPAAVAASVLAPSLGFAQLTDAERSAARDLFKQGDDLQRSGHYAEALDKFQRAEQVIQAPTNVLRVAECQAALGKVVEAAESYRTVIRWALPAGAPPAFQSAIDQAKGELAQVEPRVPRLVVQVTPANVPGEELSIDGTAVPAALIGEPFPLDPGDHKVLVSAPGYASPEQHVTLKEHETKTMAVELRPYGGAVVPAPPGSASPPPPPPVYDGQAAPASSDTSAPPPPPKRPSASILLGAHLGLSAMTGSVPLDQSLATGTSTAQVSDISGAGLGYGVEGGFRFAKRIYLGLLFDRTQFGGGKNPGSVNSSGNLTSSQTGFGVVGAVMVDPDKVSFYAELGLMGRWYTFNGDGLPAAQNYSTGELMGGIGIWVPVGRWLRLVPLATMSFGTFQSSPAQSTSNLTGNTTSGQQGHVFFLLGTQGYFNIDL